MACGREVVEEFVVIAYVIAAFIRATTSPSLHKLVLVVRTCSAHTVRKEVQFGSNQMKTDLATVEQQSQ